MSLQTVTEPLPVWEYFHVKLGLHPSDDFRGVCHLAHNFTPGAQPSMDDVAIAVGYNAFIGRTCCMHVVINRPELLTRTILRESFEFPFVTCGCEAVVGLVDSTNEAALEFDTRLGFKEACRIANAGAEGDLVILRMLRSECRWLRPH